VIKVALKKDPFLTDPCAIIELKTSQRQTPKMKKYMWKEWRKHIDSITADISSTPQEKYT